MNLNVNKNQPNEIFAVRYQMAKRIICMYSKKQLSVVKTGFQR